MFPLMNSLILKTTRSQYGSPFDDAENDYVVLDGDHVVGRIFLSPQSPPDRNWMWTIYRLSTIDPYSRLFRDTRASDGGFQGAVGWFNEVA